MYAEHIECRAGPALDDPAAHQSVPPIWAPCSTTQVNAVTGARPRSPRGLCAPPDTWGVNSDRSWPAIHSATARPGATPSCSAGASAAATSASSSSAKQGGKRFYHIMASMPQCVWLACPERMLRRVPLQPKYASAGAENRTECCNSICRIPGLTCADHSQPQPGRGRPPLPSESTPMTMSCRGWARTNCSTAAAAFALAGASDLRPTPVGWVVILPLVQSPGGAALPQGLQTTGAGGCEPRIWAA
jgi:hypothetical protein